MTHGAIEKASGSQSNVASELPTHAGSIVVPTESSGTACDAAQSVEGARPLLSWSRTRGHRPAVLYHINVTPKNARLCPLLGVLLARVLATQVFFNLGRITSDIVVGCVCFYRAVCLYIGRSLGVFSACFSDR